MSATAIVRALFKESLATDALGLLYREFPRATMGEPTARQRAAPALTRLQESSGRRPSYGPPQSKRRSGAFTKPSRGATMVFNVSRLAALGAWSAVLFLAAGGAAAAHPLGNFTINHLAEIRPQAGALRVHYVLDIAEIPTFQIMNAATWTPQRRRAWENEEALRVAAGLSIKAGGATLPMRLERATVAHPSGRGRASHPVLDRRLHRIGAREIADSRARSRLRGSAHRLERHRALPGLSEPTNDLRSYPSALIGSPRHNDVATFDFSVNGRVALRCELAATMPRLRGGRARSYGSSALSDLFSRGNPNAAP